MDRIRLDRAALPRLRPPVQRPGFDPAAVTPGIVHLGLGGFHRAHMARYTHDLMERRPDSAGVGHRRRRAAAGGPADAESLAPQDGLYTLVERSGARRR